MSKSNKTDFDVIDLIKQSRRMRRKKLFRKIWNKPHKLKPLIILFLVLIVGAGLFSETSSGSFNVTCTTTNVIDGDTFDCNSERIRLAGIDSPEMPGHCREGRRCTPGDPYAAQGYLRKLASGNVECRRIETDKYGRTIARCRANGEDLSCAMIASGHAVRRYSFITCF